MNKKVTINTQATQEEAKVKGYKSPKNELHTNKYNENKNNGPRIKSYCRIRPFNGVNKSFFKFANHEGNQAHRLSANQSCFEAKTLIDLGQNYNYDFIFDEEYTQFEIFQETCVRLINNLVDDKKSSVIFTHGLNDSGKTFTTVGDTENPGLLPLSLRLIYDNVKEKSEAEDLKIFCNFFEIYDNKGYDLLSSTTKEITFSSINCNINKFHLKDVTYFNLNTIQDFSDALNISNSRKKTKNKSSLSNTIFKIIIRYNEGDITKESSFSIVDTAFPKDKDFFNLLTINPPDDEIADIYTIQQSICYMIRTLTSSYDSGMKALRTSKIGHNQFLRFVKHFIYSTDDIVLITTIKPSLDFNEENLKFLFFSQLFVDAVNNIDNKRNGIRTTSEVKSLIERKEDFFMKNSNNDKKNSNFNDLIKIEEKYHKTSSLTNSEKSYESVKNNSFIHSPSVNDLIIQKSESDMMQQKYQELLKKAKDQEMLLQQILIKKEKQKNEIKPEESLDHKKLIEQLIKLNMREEKENFGVNLIQNNNNSSKESSISEEINKCLKDYLKETIVPLGYSKLNE